MKKPQKMIVNYFYCHFFQSNDDRDTRQLELEQKLLENRLCQQRIQSEADSKWLLEEENNLRKRLSITG